MGEGQTGRGGPQGWTANEMSPFRRIAVWTKRSGRTPGATRARTRLSVPAAELGAGFREMRLSDPVRRFLVLAVEMPRRGRTPECPGGGRLGDMPVSRAGVSPGVVASREAVG